MTGLCTSGRFHVRLLRDQLVVVDHELGEMRVLNGTASLLWLLLDERTYTLTQLNRSLAELFSEATADMTGFTQATIEEWRALGWLETVAGGYRITRRQGTTMDGLRGRGVWHGPQTPLPEHSEQVTLKIRLGDKFFRVKLSTTGKSGHANTLGRLQAVLSGMVCNLDFDKSIDLSWVHDGSEFWLQTPDAVLRTKNESLALSSVITILFKKAYGDRGIFATLHAAAVSRYGSVVLLPGASGSGKSTLTAFLVAQGWDYLGDDVIALGRTCAAEAFEVLALPTAVGVKAGSWPVLRTLYPVIDALPVIPYADRAAKFLPLFDADTEFSLGRQTPRVMVLPRYVPGQALSVTPIEPVQALCELIATGITTGESIDASRIDTLLELLEELPVYMLRHGGDMCEVDTALKGLLACA